MFFISLSADVNVHSHIRQDGVYIPGHLRSDPNSTKADNWSTRGNINPHTERPGTK